jgi:hypothetical protein
MRNSNFVYVLKMEYVPKINICGLKMMVTRTNRENTRDIINRNVYFYHDQRSRNDLPFESFGRSTMAKVLKDELRAASFDKKYGDFEFEEKNQQENPEIGNIIVSVTDTETMFWSYTTYLFVTSKKPNHEFTNLNCCQKTRESFNTL